MLTAFKRLSYIFFGITVIFTTACTKNEGPEFTLKLHHFLSAKAPAHSKMLAPWAERIEKASNGRIKIEIYPAMALGGKPPELIRQLQDGEVDIVWTVNGYTAGIFPRSEVFELPFIHTNNAVATNLAMRDMFEEYLSEDYKNVHLLFNHVHGGQAIHMVEKEVRKPADMKGLKMRIPTRTGAWVIGALGAQPVGIPVPQLPKALSEKTVDGAFIPWEIIPPLKLQDITKYQIEGVDKTRFGNTVFQVSMNKGVWNQLPADLQKVFDDNTGADWAREVGEIWMAADDFGIGMATKAGNTHITLSKEETEVFHKTLEPVVDRWIEDVTNKGIDGKGLVQTARALIAKYSNAAEEAKAPNAGAEFTLKLHHLLGPKSPAHTKMLVPWAERIETASKGRVKIEIYPAMSLGGKPPELFRQVQDGVVDLIWTVNGYTAGLFPRSEVFELPFIHTNNSIATNLAMRDMYDKYLKEEYQSVHLLFNHVHGGQAIHMVEKQVRKPADLAGTKMRIPSRTGAWAIAALGANPVGMPVPELPQALSKKVVDGAFIPWEIIPPLKLQELTKYQIEGLNGTRFGNTVFQVSMNNDSWKKLPADIQAIFTNESGADWVREVGQIWMDADTAGIGVATRSGNTHITLTEAETKAFQTKLEPVVERWIKDVAGKGGINGKELVNVARNTITKYSK